LVFFGVWHACNIILRKNVHNRIFWQEEKKPEKKKKHYYKKNKKINIYERLFLTIFFLILCYYIIFLLNIRRCITSIWWSMITKNRKRRLDINSPMNFNQMINWYECFFLGMIRERNTLDRNEFFIPMVWYYKIIFDSDLTMEGLQVWESPIEVLWSDISGKIESRSVDLKLCS